MTNDELEAIKKRCKAATEGPWYLEDDFVPHSRTDAILSILDGAATVDDYNFIAHARTDIPALIAEVERLKEELDKVGIFLRECLQEFYHDIHTPQMSLEEVLKKWGIE